MKQEQFLNLASAEEALKKFRDAVNPAPLGAVSYTHLTLPTICSV